MGRVVRVGLVQMAMGGNVVENLEKALTGIQSAAEKGANVVCLPELFLSPYFCQRPDDREAFKLAESIPSTATEALGASAKKHGIVVIGGSVFEKSEEKYFNTTPVFDTDGTMLGTYRKTHIPEDILYHEKQYFMEGDTGVKIFDTKFGKIAPLICYDQWYPEAARIAALKGAEIIFYPTAIGVIDGEVEENITGDWEGMWRNVMLGHAAANNVYICALNRVGREGAITFWGGSFIADPSSAILQKAENGEQMIVADCDLDRVKAIQDAWRFFPNRRPGEYGDITTAL